MKSLFPQEMISGNDMSIEGIASKLTYFHEQLHLIHWQTSIYAEHLAMGSLYDYVHDFKDSVIEKIMGYTNRKPGTVKMLPIMTGVTSVSVVTELKEYAKELKVFAETNKFLDISNMADDLSGNAAKTLYLLTLS